MGQLGRDAVSSGCMLRILIHRGDYVRWMRSDGRLGVFANAGRVFGWLWRLGGDMLKSVADGIVDEKYGLDLSSPLKGHDIMTVAI